MFSLFLLHVCHPQVLAFFKNLVSSNTRREEIVFQYSIPSVAQEHQIQYQITNYIDYANVHFTTGQS